MSKGQLSICLVSSNLFVTYRVWILSQHTIAFPESNSMITHWPAGENDARIPKDNQGANVPMTISVHNVIYDFRVEVGIGRIRKSSTFRFRSKNSFA
jgi:hypothetical protein